MTGYILLDAHTTAVGRLKFSHRKQASACSYVHRIFGDGDRRARLTICGGVL